MNTLKTLVKATTISTTLKALTLTTITTLGILVAIEAIKNGSPLWF